MNVPTIPDPSTIHPELTRVTNTTNTYARLIAGLRPFLPDSHILDYGAGFGHGTSWLLTRYPNAYAYDIAPPADPPPNVTYLTSDELDTNRPFDIILGVYLLNVLPPPDRRTTVLHIASLLSPGGVAAFAVRPWYNDVERTSTGIPAPEPKALYVPRSSDTYTYQRGYDHIELALELDWYLRDVPGMTTSHILPSIGRSPVATIHREGVPT